VVASILDFAKMAGTRLDRLRGRLRTRER
jgi:hypothetical protein